MKRDSDKVVGLLEDLVARIAVELTLSIQNQLILTTPVDTGFARSNWVSSIGFAIADTPQNNESIAELKYELTQGPIFLVNNTVYINVLNRGHSQQAPAGFVEASIVRGIQGLKGKATAL